MATQTKSARVISLMNENADKPMLDVISLIERELGFTNLRSRQYYLWAVREGLAAGTVEKARRAPLAAKKAKVEDVKPVAEPKPKATKKVAKAEKPKAEAKPKGKTAKKAVAAKEEDSGRSPEDLAAIKAANLKRMKEVTAKMKARGLSAGQYANPENVGVPDGWTAEGARAEVDAMYKELDSFEMPKFLTKDQVKYMV